MANEFVFDYDCEAKACLGKLVAMADQQDENLTAHLNCFHTETERLCAKQSH